MDPGESPLFELVAMRFQGVHLHLDRDFAETETSATDTHVSDGCWCSEEGVYQVMNQSLHGMDLVGLEEVDIG